MVGLLLYVANHVLQNLAVRSANTVDPNIFLRTRIRYKLFRRCSSLKGTIGPKDDSMSITGTAVGIVVMIIILVAPHMLVPVAIS